MNTRPAILTALLLLLPLPGAFAETAREQLIQVIKKEFPAILASQGDPEKQQDEEFRKHLGEVEKQCEVLMDEIRKTDPRTKQQIMEELLFEALPEQREKLVEARGMARNVASANNLRQIGMAFHMYLADNNKAPDKLVDLIPYLGDNEKVLLSPAVKDHKRRKTDYLYFGANIKEADLGNAPVDKTVLACDRFGNNNGKSLNVLFLDGHVEMIELNDQEPLFKGKHDYLNKQLTKTVLQAEEN